MLWLAVVAHLASLTPATSSAPIPPPDPVVQTTPGCAQIRQAMIVPKWASSTRFDALVSSDPASNPGTLNAEAAKLAADKTEAARLFADLGLRADPEAVADIVLRQACLLELSYVVIAGAGGHPLRRRM